METEIRIAPDAFDTDTLAVLPASLRVAVAALDRILPVSERLTRTLTNVAVTAAAAVLVEIETGCALLLLLRMRSTSFG